MAARLTSGSVCDLMLLLSNLAALLESGRLPIINTPTGQELTAELNSFEVDFTSAGNMRVDLRSKDHHGDLVIATALALRSAVGRPSVKIEVGKLPPGRRRVQSVPTYRNAIKRTTFRQPA